MSDHAPFLAAILARPDDDLPRLVYADWLEETDGMAPCSQCVGGWIGCVFRDADGESSRTARTQCPTCHGTGDVSNGHAERAEFIRVQIEIARQVDSKLAYGCCGTGHGDPGGTCIWCRTRRRERDLLLTQQHWHHWQDFDELGFCKHLDNFNPDDRGERDIGLVFRRGFVEVITCSWPDFRQHADAIMAATPLRRVRLTGEMPPADLALYFHFNVQRACYLSGAYPGIEFQLPQQEPFEMDIGLQERLRQHGTGMTNANPGIVRTTT